MSVGLLFYLWHSVKRISIKDGLRLSQRSKVLDAAEIVSGHGHTLYFIAIYNVIGRQLKIQFSMNGKKDLAGN